MSFEGAKNRSLITAHVYVCVFFFKCIYIHQENVQWACPACSAKVEVTEMTAPQQKPKRERKDGKKRQRASSATAGSPRDSGEGAGTSFTIPKRKKEQKRAKAQGPPRGGASAQEGLESHKSPRVKMEGKEGKPTRDAAAGGGGGDGGGSSTRIANAPKQPRVLPRMGLGLADAAAAAEILAMRGQDVCGSRHARIPSKSMMSLAVAAASVAASEAAAAVAAAATVAATAAAAAPPPAPAPPAPPKALGLKKLLHQRVQYDEASANPTSAFSPKKLLKHRLLAAHANQQQASSAPAPAPTLATTPATAPALAPTPKMEGGGLGYGVDEKNEPSPRGDPATTGGGPCEGGRFEGGGDNGSAGGRWEGDGGSGGGGFTASREGEVGGRGFGGAATFGGGRRVVAADGATVNGGHAGESGDYSRRYGMRVGGEDSGGVGGIGGSGGGGGAGGGSGGGSNGQDLGGDVGGEESLGDGRNRAMGAGCDKGEVGAGEDREPNPLNGMHVAPGVRKGNPKEEAMRFAQGADAAERSHGGGGDAGRWPGGGEVERRDAPREHEHPAPSFGRHSHDGQEVSEGIMLETRGGKCVGGLAKHVLRPLLCKGGGQRALKEWQARRVRCCRWLLRERYSFAWASARMLQDVTWSPCVFSVALSLVF